MKKILLILAITSAAILAQEKVVTKTAANRIEARETKAIEEVVTYNLDELVKEEAAILKELERVRALIASAKKVGAEPSEAVAEIVAENATKAADIKGK